MYGQQNIKIQTQMEARLIDLNYNDGMLLNTLMLVARVIQDGVEAS